MGPLFGMGKWTIYYLVVFAKFMPLYLNLRHGVEQLELFELL